MNGGKDNHGCGGGSGLRGGKLKKVARGRKERDIVLRDTDHGSGGGFQGGKSKKVAGGSNDCGMVFRGNNLHGGGGNRGGGDVGGKTKRAEGGHNDPKHPVKKVIVEKNKVWTHGPYVMIEPPNGGDKIVFRRNGAGSCSQVGEGDRMADLAGLLRTTTPLPDVSHGIQDNDDSYENSGDGGGSGDGGSSDDGGAGDDGSSGEGGGYIGDGDGDDDGREFIQCNKNKKKFSKPSVQRSVKKILEQFLDGDWITFTEVPQNVRTRMFDRFRTKYRWDPRADQAIYDVFINVLKGRFRDMMSKFRKKSKLKAREVGYIIPDDEDYFDIQCKYPPPKVPREKWKRMCKSWDTEKWKNKSRVGRENRKNDVCLHTGGSIGFDEHRVNMEKEKGKKVGYKKLFIQTHATKKCKKMLQDGEINENDFEQLEFVTERSKRSYISYCQQLEKLHGDKTDRDDFSLWESLHPECRGRQLFGVGSSDPSFVVTGTPSSMVCGSYGDPQQPHEFEKVQVELEKEREARQNIEARIEQLQQEREQERVEHEREREKDRAEQAVWRKNMEELFKKFGKK